MWYAEAGKNIDIARHGEKIQLLHCLPETAKLVVLDKTSTATLLINPAEAVSLLPSIDDADCGQEEPDHDGHETINR